MKRIETRNVKKSMNAFGNLIKFYTRKSHEVEVVAFKAFLF